jgi:hypothetical protein
LVCLLAFIVLVNIEGMSRQFQHDASKTISGNVGTLIYNAPELWNVKASKAEGAFDSFVPSLAVC